MVGSSVLIDLPGNMGGKLSLAHRNIDLTKITEQASGRILYLLASSPVLLLLDTLAATKTTGFNTIPFKTNGPNMSQGISACTAMVHCNELVTTCSLSIHAGEAR